MLTRPARPALAATYEGRDPRLLERMLPLVDFIEIAPDSIARQTEAGLRIDPVILDELERCRLPILVHGVGLSIASADGWSGHYLPLLDAIFERLPVAWHSEHLAYARVDGEDLGTMLPPPATHEALDLIADCVARLRARYPVPFLLEHVARILPEPPGDYSPAGFLNALARESGCGILIDAYNLECDRENLGRDVDAFLDELDFTHVREMHVAGGTLHKGFRMDVHSRRLDEATRRRAADILSRAPHLGAVTFEFLRQAVPTLGHDAICAELAALRTMLADAR
jgi:uncharacterized protein